MSQKTITINHIGKTEGHLGLEATLQQADMASARILTLEGARLMEGIVLNRSYYDVPIITARICGVCPIVHNLAAIKALEMAMNVEPTAEIVLLRKIFNLAQWIHSHALHVYFLSFPDFVGVNNDFDLVKKYTKQSTSALVMRDWALRLCDVIGGRATHPINSVVGGFKVVPDEEKLQALHAEIQDAKKMAIKIVEFVKSKAKPPKFSNQTLYAGMKSKSEYAHYDGVINVGDKQKVNDPLEYLKYFEEYCFQGEGVKRVKYFEQPFMVGSLARVNLNGDKLNPLAKKIWKSFKASQPCYNSFFNTLAQAVEIIHAFEELEKLLPKYLKLKNKKLFVDFKPQAGKGVGVVEAPRGILIHYYELNNQGIVINSNIITPTAMFLANLENDLGAFLPQIQKFPVEKQKLLLKTLVRAYDPCISCATH